MFQFFPVSWMQYWLVTQPTFAFASRYHRKLRKFTIWFDESTQKHLGGWQEDCHVFVLFLIRLWFCRNFHRPSNIDRLEILNFWQWSCSCCWGFGGEVGPTILIQQKLPRRALSTGTSLALGRMLGTDCNWWLQDEAVLFSELPCWFARKEAPEARQKRGGTK